MSFLKSFFTKKGIKIFDEFDTNNNQYRFLITNIREQNSQSNYFLDDASTIQNLPNKWKLPLADSICRGGYDYAIRIFNGQQQEQLILVCFLCNRLSFQGSTDQPYPHLFELSEKKFISLIKNDFQPIDIISKQFSTRTEALEFWEKEQHHPKLIKLNALLPDWMKFEGEYTLNFSMNPSTNRETPKKFLNETISKLGDLGEYELSQIMVSSDGDISNYLFSIKSSSALYDKIDECEPQLLFKSQEKSEFIFFLKEWTEFNDFNFQLYYRK